MSPGVITETVWALAHEDPPVWPEFVVVLTTAHGREVLVKELLDSGVWERLCAQLGTPNDRLRFGHSSDAIRVFPTRDRRADLRDIITGADNEAAADFILTNVRQYTDLPQTRLIVSLAGGRKTMGVLCGQALSLVGRWEDRLCHVLVNPPFDAPDLSPRFYFPDQTVVSYQHPSSASALTNADAQIHLADVPFVPLRYLAGQPTSAPLGAFMDTVAALRRTVTACAGTVELRLELRESRCTVNGQPVSLSHLEFALYYLLARRCLDQQGPILGYKDLHQELQQFLDHLKSEEFPPRIHCLEKLANWEHTSTLGDLRKVVSGVKAKLLKALGQRVGAICSPVDPKRRGRCRLDLPVTNVILDP